MKVLYYTATPFMDIAIEIVNIIKNDFELHVIIEITPNNAHRVGLKNLNSLNGVLGADELICNEDYQHFIPYFAGCASINFIVHPSESGFSFSTIKMFHKTWLLVKGIKPDIIHIETISLRSLGLIPFIFSKKKFFFTIHDPVPHSGDANWKVAIPKYLFLKLPYPRVYFFYSQFSKNLFQFHYKKDKYPKYSLRMHPYSIYKKFVKKKLPIRKHILFFGSLSLYKGIGILLQAIPDVFKKHPNTKLIIAGNSNPNYNINQDFPTDYKDNIMLINRYIPNYDLVNLVLGSKIVVCPYLDATQSGVLMTAFAMNTPVIASNVGSFSEYIYDNINGLIVAPQDPKKLAIAINHLLIDDSYKNMIRNIKIYNKTNHWTQNLEIIADVYHK